MEIEGITVLISHIPVPGIPPGPPTFQSTFIESHDYGFAALLCTRHITS